MLSCARRSNGDQAYPSVEAHGALGKTYYSPPATACCGFECSRSYRADKRFESLPRSAAPALIAVRAGLGRCFETRDTRWRGADCETGAYMNEAPGEPGHWSVIRYPVR